MTKQEKLAAMFVNAYKPAFEQAEQDGEAFFTISKKEFDQWLTTTGMTDPFFVVPEPGSIEWGAWVTLRHGLRTRLNSAAEIAQHGEPPYSIEKDPNDRELWRVTMLNGIIAFRFDDATKALASLAKSKGGSVEKVFGMLEGHTQHLPPQAQMMLNIKKQMFTKAAARVARDMNELLLEMKDYTTQTQAFIASQSNASLITHQTDDDEYEGI